MAQYEDEATDTRAELNKLSPSMCMAKWLQVSLHLPQGRTHSCYHPPTHPIPLDELKKSPSALHNTKFKLEERKQMKEGEGFREAKKAYFEALREDQDDEE